MSDIAKSVAGSGASPRPPSNPCTVRVADNFHYQDASETYTQGSYATYAEAVKVSGDIVCRSLLELAKPGMSGTELYQQYTTFGEDPFIVGAGPGDPPFGAWTYAKQLCEAIRSPSPKPTRQGRIFAPYYALKRKRLSCPECGWRGTGNDLTVSEVYESGIIEYTCPRCSFDIAFTAGPTVQEHREHEAELGDLDREVLSRLDAPGPKADASPVVAADARGAQGWLRFLRWPW